MTAPVNKSAALCETDSGLKRLLVIDDDTSVLFALKKLFNSALVKVDTSESLEEAKECIDSNRYNLILTDLGFSEVVSDAGIEIAIYAKSKYPGVKIILWTGSENASLTEKARAADVDYVFRKPLSPLIIKKIMENLYFM
ncbi:MAG: response regulator [Chitinispirillaceae bacterium]